MRGWIGATKGSPKHREILDIYNGHRPLARNYQVQTRDAYCATTVSAAWIKAGIAEYTGTECSVQKLVEIAQRKGIWIENDAYMPKVGDACVYDWQDNGVGDDRGSGDHIGIVTAVLSGSFIVTEGNMAGGRVGTRTVKRNGRYIRGFIAPDYGEIARKMGGEPEPLRCQTIGEVREKAGYAESIVRLLIGNGSLRGSGKKDKDGLPADLDLSKDMLRMLTILDRNHVFGR